MKDLLLKVGIDIVADKIAPVTLVVLVAFLFALTAFFVYYVGKPNKA